jgi:hypothetical protein
MRRERSLARRIAEWSQGLVLAPLGRGSPTASKQDNVFNMLNHLTIPVFR